MSLFVYAMWVYRVEKQPPESDPDKVQAPRHVQVEFSPDYKLHHSHQQRIASELRVPLFEGYTMPTSFQDSESAALYKQLLTRPIAITPATDSEDPEDVRLVKAFLPYCASRGTQEEDRSFTAAKAFTVTWLAFRQEQTTRAMEGRRRFLDRFEYPSLWETEEMQQELGAMYEEYQDSRYKGDIMDDELASEARSSPDDPDANKPRATVAHYVAINGQEVSTNLEGIARARAEKHPKLRETDAKVHEAYLRATTGGGEAGSAEADDSAVPVEGCVKTSATQFPPLPWGFSDLDEMNAILAFEKRARSSAFSKELLALP